MTVAGEARVAATGKELLRALATLALVMGGATAGLAALDAAPAWLQGEPRGVRRLASVDEAERRLKARLYLPAFFPDRYRWPPSTVRLILGDPSSVALGFEAREGGLALQLAQTVGGEGPVSPLVLPPAEALQRSAVRLGSEEATLARVLGEDGKIWHEVAWRQGGRTLVLRGRGGVEELLRMARSAHKEGP
ncbi:MAG TPA: hypothetical protein VEP68_05030 [Anaeromyxobacteraceae bacterium]|nr:hypothetical protein [Anaeromyxobacteraceae bacterium]